MPRLEEAASVIAFSTSPNNGFVWALADGTVKNLRYGVSIHVVRLVAEKMSKDKRVTILAFGGVGQYLIKDAMNGSYLSYDLRQIIKGTHEVRFVALGSPNSSYFCILMSGAMMWRELPSVLERILWKCRKSELPPVEFVGLGRKNNILFASLMENVG